MANNRKVLPFINPSGAPIDTDCEICNTLIVKCTGYPIVYAGKIDGYVCDACFERQERVKDNPGFKFTVNER